MTIVTKFLDINDSMAKNDLVIVDLSHYQEVYSFADAKKAGLIGVIHKCTEGTTFVDDKYAERQQLAADAGLHFGAYHYLHHNSVDLQMEWFLRNAKLPHGSRAVIDYEDQALSLYDLETAVEYLNYIDPSLQIAVYGGSLLKEQLGDDTNATLAQASLWVAHYTTGVPKWPKGTWPYWSLWQYSDGSVGGSPKSVPGISKPHDCNAFNGSRENCEKWIAPTGQAGGEGSGDEAKEVTISISIEAPEGVSVTIKLNGVPYGGT